MQAGKKLNVSESFKKAQLKQRVFAFEFKDGIASASCEHAEKVVG